ncbi:MAG: hypothetical protein KGI38_03360 [Thaumarchaeota archaeon]|nr:hypothetical protein [Nitrososphaerota archaeon]
MRRVEQLDPFGDSELERAFRTRANQIFGSKQRSVDTAIDEALELWLAWRGDPAYLIAALGKRPEREMTWRVIKYTQVPELTAKYDETSTRSLGGPFPDHILAFLVRFVTTELDCSRGGELLSEGQGDTSSEIQSERIRSDEVFGRLKRGATITAKWPSLKAPSLSRKLIILSTDRIKCSKYPALDNAGSRKAVGFMRFLEKSEKKNRTRWVMSRG